MRSPLLPYRPARPHADAIAGVSLALFATSAAVAGERAPVAAPLVIGVHENLDVWRNTQGGLKVGDTQLSKLQIVLDFDSDTADRSGWKARLQYFRTNGESLSGGRVGDIQTASNIEALSTDRLMEAWVERQIGQTVAVRVGLMDLNADFDSIEPAGLFIDSSHGIAPDLSKSGRNGPSIFPVSSLGMHVTWSPSATLALRAAAFDGVPGNPDHPKAFTAIELSRRDGALLIGQADWMFAEGAQASFAAWGYTASFDRIDQPSRRQHGQAGTYAFVEGPLPIGTGWTGWVRAGIADADFAVVDDYLGFGVVKAAPFASRKDDRLGFAVSRAGIGGPARRASELPRAETTFEATYRYQINDTFALQPDVQYVRHPASQAGLEDALVIGLRMTLSLTHAFGAEAR